MYLIYFIYLFIFFPFLLKLHLFHINVRSFYPFGTDAGYLETNYDALAVATVPLCNELLELAAFKKKKSTFITVLITH